MSISDDDPPFDGGVPITKAAPKQETANETVDDVMAWLNNI
jgi:hypothetical protein